jgi:hypothetical protein
MFQEYPEPIRIMTVNLLMSHIAAGHALNTNVIKASG